MCLEVRKDQIVLRTAEQNMPCYKVLIGNEAQHRDYRYTRGRLNEEKGVVSCVVEDDNLAVESTEIKVAFGPGFHSYIPNKAYTHSKVDLFVIPKGAVYITGGDNFTPPTAVHHEVYLSEAIIWAGKNNWFNRLLAKWNYGVDFK